MQFPVDVASLCHLDEEGFALLSFDTLHPGLADKKDKLLNLNATNFKPAPGEADLNRIVDRMGVLSAQAQGLKAPVTTFSKLMSSGEHLYIKGDGNYIFGILKVGAKRLFYRDMDGNIKEIQPLCVLDFYVHESCQRSGIGRFLFDKMLAYERIYPHKLGYDRPSFKLLSFLKKHFKLEKFIPQNNNFVVFNEYFNASYQSVFELPPPPGPAREASRKAPQAPPQREEPVYEPVKRAAPAQEEYKDYQGNDDYSPEYLAYKQYQQQSQSDKYGGEERKDYGGNFADEFFKNEGNFRENAATSGKSDKEQSSQNTGGWVPRGQQNYTKNVKNLYGSNTHFAEKPPPSKSDKPLQPEYIHNIAMSKNERSMNDIKGKISNTEEEIMKVKAKIEELQREKESTVKSPPTSNVGAPVYNTSLNKTSSSSYGSHYGGFKKR